MKQRLIFVVAILSAFFGIAMTSGCERSYGITRTARLPSYPPPDCVIEAIEHVAAIEAFDDHHESEEQSAGAQGRFQNVSYRGMGVEVELGVFEEADRIRLIQSHLFVNKKPTAREVRDARTLMMAVEARLGEHCDVPGLSELVREKCADVECD
jgi:hypothetical protein